MVGPVPAHLLSDNTTIESDGELSVAGVRVSELAAEFGTPLFIYDEDHLRARCREAKRPATGTVPSSRRRSIRISSMSHSSGRFAPTSRWTRSSSLSAWACPTCGAIAAT